MDDFDNHITQYEMGQAYIRITDQYGPSVQLLAFVNYDDLKNDDCLGLESFNIDTAHSQVLDQINSTNSLELACESFVGRLKSGAERFKNAITFNNHSSDLLIFTKGKLESRSSNIYVETHAEFENFLDASKKLLPLLSWVTTRFPKTHNYSDWDAFAKKILQLGTKTDFDKKNDESNDIVSRLNKDKKLLYKVDFKEAGWTTDSFQKAVKEYVNQCHISASALELAYRVQTEMNVLINQVENIVESVTVGNERNKEGKVEKTTKHVVHKVNNDNAVAIKAMNKAYRILYSTYFNLCFAERHMRVTLDDVSHHFKTIN